jgi:hypothetical protein
MCGYVKEVLRLGQSSGLTPLTDAPSDLGSTSSTPSASARASFLFLSAGEFSAKHTFMSFFVKNPQKQLYFPFHPSNLISC